MIDPREVPAADKTFAAPWAESEACQWSTEYVDQFIGLGSLFLDQPSLCKTVLIAVCTTVPDQNGPAPSRPVQVMDECVDFFKTL
jgi:hypothetical protein